MFQSFVRFNRKFLQFSRPLRSLGLHFHQRPSFRHGELLQRNLRHLGSLREVRQLLGRACSRSACRPSRFPSACVQTRPFRQAVKNSTKCSPQRKRRSAIERKFGQFHSSRVMFNVPTKMRENGKNKTAHQQTSAIALHVYSIIANKIRLNDITIKYKFRTES